MGQLTAVLVLALGFSLASAEPQTVTASNPEGPSSVSLNSTDRVPVASVDGGLANYIYDSGLQPSWISSSIGCVACSFDNAGHARNGSASSIYAEVVPWAALILESLAPFDGSSVLDGALAGNGLNRAVLFLEDSLTNRLTPKLALNSRNRSLTRVISGPDAQGWYRVQYNLAALTAASANPALAGLPSSWTRIHFADASGTGFTLRLDKLLLYATDLSLEGSAASSANTRTPFPCAGSSCKAPISSVPAAGETRLVPLFGGEVGLDSDSSTGAFIMRYSDATTASQANELCAELSGDGLNRFQGQCVTAPELAKTANSTPSGNLSWSFQTFKVQAQSDLDAMRASLGDVVAYMERDGTVKVDVVSSLQLNTSGRDARAASATIPWGLDRIDQPALPLDNKFDTGGLDGSGIHIYTLDTGLRASHSDFTGRVGESTCLLPGCSSTDDIQGHGTHVAGTAAGKIHGVAKGATIHAVKVMGDDGSGSYSAIISGMQWIKDHAAANKWRAVAVMSLGGPVSQSLNDASSQLIAAGIPVVTSAGNRYGADACTQSPASTDGAVAVGATTAQDTLASYSNVGSCVTVFAPGTNILSAGITGDAAEALMSGTSMAAPHAAGALALLLQARPGAGTRELVDSLNSAAADIVFSSASPPRLLQCGRLAPGAQAAG